MSASRGYIETMPPELLADPLSYIFADHFRQRIALNLLKQLAGGTPDWRGIAAAVEAYLRQDMAVHILDEEQDLFPVLRIRCEPDDEIDPLLDLLLREHRQALQAADRIAGGLRELRPPADDPSLCAAMMEFTEGERRHLAVENGVVLALARVRLTPGDLRRLSAGMTARRPQAG